MAGCPGPTQAVRTILGALPLNGVAVFYQTDVRLAEKGQVSKAFLVLKAAQEVPQAWCYGRWLMDQVASATNNR